MVSFVATMHESATSEQQLTSAEAVIQLPVGQDVEEEYDIFSPKIVVFQDAEELFREAEAVVMEALHSYDSPRFSFPTGNTPVKLYERLRNRRKENPEDVDFSNSFVRGLDEYWDKYRRYSNGQEGSFKEYFDTHVYGKDGLNVPPTHRLHPNMQALDPFVDAAVFEKRQRLQGPAHLAVIGMGRNGHIAFNEPGSPRYSRSRLVTITQDTREANKGDIDGPFRGDSNNVPEHAITQGIGNLLESEQIIALVLGEQKADALQKAIDEAVSAEVPASWLRTHPHQQVTIFVDVAAASRLPR